MIIECQTCHARFRLDESRIKGRGARVKCRKCGDAIVVLRGSVPPPAPPAEGGAGHFDLGSAVRDPGGATPASPSPVGNLIPFPAPSRPEEPPLPDPFSSSAETPATGKDEVDLAFERVLFAGTEASSPSSEETEAEIPAPAEQVVPADRDASTGPGSLTEPGPGALTLDLSHGEKLDLPPAAPASEQEPTFGETPAAEPAPDFHGEGGFLISDSETLDFLQEKHPDAGSESPPDVSDISLGISSTPVDESRPSLREPDAPGTSGEGRVPPAPAMPGIELPTLREAAPAPPAETAAHPVSPAPESPRRRSAAGPAVAAVLAALLAAGGYLGFTTSGRKTLEGVFPGASALWGEKAAVPAAQKYDLRNVIGYYESGAASPRILVIKGQVANLATVEKSGIRVYAALLDNTDAVQAQQVVYAGNVLSGEALRKGDRDTLSKVLGNRFGEGLANMHVAPGKAIPFMIVFFDAPANIDSYKLEAKDGE